MAYAVALGACWGRAEARALSGLDTWATVTFPKGNNPIRNWAPGTGLNACDHLASWRYGSCGKGGPNGFFIHVRQTSNVVFLWVPFGIAEINKLAISHC